MNRSIVTAVSVAASLAFGGPAFAHAHLTLAEPAADAIVEKAPTDLELHFSEGVEAKFARIKIKGADGKDVPVQGIAGAPGDKKTLLVTPASPLAAGRYQVTWSVVSVDTHKTEGTYSFTIQP